MSRATSLKPLLALIAFACFAMLGAALLLQHLAGWEPCTLCIQIRLWLLCGGVLSLLILLLEGVSLRWLTLPLWPLLLAAAGMGEGGDQPLAAVVLAGGEGLGEHQAGLQ